MAGSAADETNGKRGGPELSRVSGLPATLAGMTGIYYFAAAALLGGAFLGISIASLRDLGARARLLFATSIFYLSLILLMMVIDKA